MKKNKKLNLSEAAAQVMGGVKTVMDATGQSDMDMTGHGSMVPAPVDTTGVPVTAASAGQPGVPATMRTSGGGIHATAAYQDSDEESAEEDTATQTDYEEGEENEEDETKKKEMQEAFRSAILSLLGEENVNAKALNQLEAIFEAAVSDRVESEVAKVLVELDENAKDYLSNVTNSLVEKVDDYLEYVVEEWMTENTVAVEQGIKTTIAENFISGLKNLFENHYIDVPNEKYNVLDELYEQNRKLQEALNESMKSSIDLKKEIALTECAGIFVAETKNLADTQVNKLQHLMENINFNSPEEYRNKLVAIKENYLQGNRVSVPSKTVDEDMTFSKAVSAPVTLVENYANVLGRLNKKL
jgi:hypothetical protein